MEFRLSREAQKRMAERGISEGMVRAAIRGFEAGTALSRSDGEGGVRINMVHQKGMYAVAYAPEDRVVKTVTWIVEAKDGQTGSRKR